MKNILTKKGHLHYKGCGLDNIYLSNGFNIKEFDGEKAVSIDNVDGLHRAIALQLSTKQKNLTAKEIRFLRKFLDLSQKSLASMLRQDIQNLARWEKDEHKINGSADILLKMIVFGSINNNSKVLSVIEMLNEIEDKEHKKLILSEKDQKWGIAC